MRNVPVLDKWLGAKYVEFGTTNSTDTCISCFMLDGKDVPATYEVVDGNGTRLPVCTFHAESAKAALAAGVDRG